MKIKICSSKFGVLYNGQTAKIEVFENGGKIVFAFTDETGRQQEIYEDDYTVVKFGEAKNKISGWISEKGKPTTWDLAERYEESVKICKELNVDIDHVCFYLPDENNLAKAYGPMPIAEARDICRKFWRVEG